MDVNPTGRCSTMVQSSAQVYGRSYWVICAITNMQYDWVRGGAQIGQILKDLDPSSSSWPWPLTSWHMRTPLQQLVKGGFIIPCCCSGAINGYCIKTIKHVESVEHQRLQIYASVIYFFCKKKHQMCSFLSHEVSDVLWCNKPAFLGVLHCFRCPLTT